MKDPEIQSQKETKQAQKRMEEEAKSLAREQKVKNDYLAKEELRERATKAKEAEWAKKRTAENIKELERENSRKEAYLAREKKIALEQKDKNLKNT
jgi:hypothetical protein